MKNERRQVDFKDNLLNMKENQIKMKEKFRRQGKISKNKTEK